MDHIMEWGRLHFAKMRVVRTIAPVSIIFLVWAMYTSRLPAIKAINLMLLTQLLMSNTVTPFDRLVNVQENMVKERQLPSSNRSNGLDEIVIQGDCSLEVLSVLVAGKTVEIVGSTCRFKDGLVRTKGKLLAIEIQASYLSFVVLFLWLSGSGSWSGKLS